MISLATEYGDKNLNLVSTTPEDIFSNEGITIC